MATEGRRPSDPLPDPKLVALLFLVITREHQVREPHHAILADEECVKDDLTVLDNSTSSRCISDRVTSRR